MIEPLRSRSGFERLLKYLRLSWYVFFVVRLKNCGQYFFRDTNIVIAFFATQKKGLTKVLAPNIFGVPKGI